MYDRFTDRSRKVMHAAHGIAREWRQQEVGTDHVLLALLKEDGVSKAILKELNVPIDSIESAANKYTFNGYVSCGEPELTGFAKRAIESAITASKELGSGYVGTEHLLIGLATDKGSCACKALNQCGITREAIIEKFKSLTNVDVVLAGTCTMNEIRESFGLKPLASEKPIGSVALNHEFEFTKDEVVSIAKLLSAKDLLALAQEKLGD